ncbi:hypothetical protein [Actinomadura rudentiformis]|uniref:Prenyltransferase n=1 Tax=Actinomadura rudentiformis TaxID=359158 RepID=A0A6H9YSZ6_9ACTN|nr:hypothetical protein [Actinomadura rudentiformis]KAB2342730.1 hypothetical protein F8566_37515 [Actinomadura rudentiformis]
MNTIDPETIDPERLARAEDFMRRNARLIDRHRFAFHFRGGPATAITAALRPYENPDGGYGHGLEPDLRGEASQPVPAQHALEFLHEAGADGDPAVGRICGYLTSIARPDGGVPFVLTTVRDAPAAPWWQAPDDPPGHIVPTGTLAGQLYRIGASHPWLGRATDFCWAWLDEATEVPPYEIYAILAFLDHVPDRERAESAFERLRAPMLAHIDLDPEAEGDVHLPLDYAAAPDGFGRRLFDDGIIEAHLDALVKAQRDDGGWTVGFPFWTPQTEPEWRGFITVDRLRTLRAYGRLSA